MSVPVQAARGRAGDARKHEQRTPSEGILERRTLKHDTERDRRRSTADEIENMLAKRFLAREKLDYADAVWLRRAVRQLRSGRIR